MKRKDFHHVLTMATITILFVSAPANALDHEKLYSSCAKFDGPTWLCYSQKLDSAESDLNRMRSQAIDAIAGTDFIPRKARSSFISTFKGGEHAFDKARGMLCGKLAEFYAYGAMSGTAQSVQSVTCHLQMIEGRVTNLSEWYGVKSEFQMY
ncbi:lysozyme inhibitor LprI family protein [Chitinivorax sp. B]|uniref:lysozyme inhibitor LprI family protein n=1 Tax=Chitinivorax sp. B TaxID=2502235 RepID=UPI0010F475B0|nr:lysozyme inhibitor LprI family protein [Chitinivorax sp. B]